MSEEWSRGEPKHPSVSSPNGVHSTLASALALQHAQARVRSRLLCDRHIP